MTRQLTVGLVAFAAVFAVGLRQATQSDQQVKRTYVGDDGKSIELLGVCSVDPDKVECWDVDGKPAFGVADRLRRYCTFLGKRLSFVVGLQNRYIVMRSNTKLNTAFYVPSMPAVGPVLDLGPDLDSVLTCVPIAVPRSQKAVDLGAEFRAKPVEADLALKTGEQVTLSGIGYTVGPVSPRPSPAYFPYGHAHQVFAPAAGKFWKLVLHKSVGDDDWGRSQGFTFEALDRDRKPISYVDVRGEPLSGDKFFAMGGNPSPGWIDSGPPSANEDQKPQCLLAEVGGSSFSAKDDTLLLNVNPERVAYLRISCSQMKRIRFTGVPLDPSP